MKVSRGQMAENRERVVTTAARLFREHGFDGIGVADLMKAAGLTHGGFYGQFASKQDLMAEASQRAGEESLQLWRKLVAQAGDESALAAVTGAYLSPLHRDHPGLGCAVAALGADAARQEPAVRRAIRKGVSALLDMLTDLMPGRARAAKRQKAVLAYASMVGALVLARAVDDEALSEEFLQVVAASLPGAAA